MICISHRGNLNGPNPVKENHPDYIITSLNLGLDCEIDVWYRQGWWLGHDVPQYTVKENWLMQPRLWLHCKDIKTLSMMKFVDYLHYFFHQNDDCTLTSKGYIWTYPGKQLTEQSICVLPELNNLNKDELNCFGVCTDFPLRYR